MWIGVEASRCRSGLSMVCVTIVLELPGAGVVGT